jgi:ABC-type branched-subunit amino acid transport system substrate-binding protein
VRKLRWLAVLALVAIVASCGRSDDNASPEDETPSDSSAPTESSAPADAPGNFGDLEGVCGPAEGENTADSDTGVTADSVQVSVFSDPGFAGRPGLNQELFDSADAFVAWCNEAGGIHGREIELKKRDAKLTEFQQRIIEACQEGDFMMVGGGAVFDDTGQRERLECGLPNVPGYVVTAQAADADLTYQPVPNPVDKLSIGDYRFLDEEFPDSTSKIAIVTGSIPTTVTVAKRNEEAIKDLGWTVVHQDQYNPQGETTWRPFAEAIKSRGVKGLVWIGEPVNLANLMKALDDIGYQLDFVRTDANHYDPLLISEGGPAVEGAYVRSVFHPFLSEEQASENPATTKYLEVMDEHKPDGKIAYLGVQGFSAWLLWAQASTACGAELTRDCVWENIGEITDWTAGGLHAPQNVAESAPGDCYSLQQVQQGEFVLAEVPTTDGIFACDPEYVITLEGNYGEGARCPNPEYADDPKPSTCGT